MIDNTEFDAGRSAALRAILVDTALQGAPKRRRTRRVVLFTSIATAAVLAVGGVGYAATTVHPSAPDGHGGIAGPSPTRSSAPVPIDTVEPEPTKEPGIVQGAGSPSPTPLPIVNDPTDPSTWVIGFDSFGPITMWSDTLAVLDGKSPYREVPGQSSPNNEAPGQSGFEVYQAPGRSRLLFMTHPDGVVFQATIDGSEEFTRAAPHTAAGIRVGSTVAELKAAYPDLVLTPKSDMNHQYDNYHVQGPNGKYIIFQTNEEETRVGWIAISTISVLYPDYGGF